MRTRYLSILKFHHEIETNRAKRLFFPTIRGTWIPCFDLQNDFGFAINWLWVRVRLSFRKKWGIAE